MGKQIWLNPIFIWPVPNVKRVGSKTEVTTMHYARHHPPQTLDRLLASEHPGPSYWNGRQRLT
jgi:hypothetical protein